MAITGASGFDKNKYFSSGIDELGEICFRLNSYKSDYARLKSLSLSRNPDLLKGNTFELLFELKYGS